MVKNMTEGLCKNLPHLPKKNRFFFYKAGLLIMLLYTDPNQICVLVYNETLLLCVAYQRIDKQPSFEYKMVGKQSSVFLVGVIGSFSLENVNSAPGEIQNSLEIETP